MKVSDARFILFVMCVHGLNHSGMWNQLQSFGVDFQLPVHGITESTFLGFNFDVNQKQLILIYNILCIVYMQETKQCLIKTRFFNTNAGNRPLWGGQNSVQQNKPWLCYRTVKRIRCRIVQEVNCQNCQSITPTTTPLIQQLQGQKIGKKCKFVDIIGCNLKYRFGSLSIN